MLLKKSSKKRIASLLPCISLGLGSLALSTSVSAYTIQEAVAHALCTGPDVLMTADNREAIDYEVRQAFAGFYPRVDLAAGYGREWSNNSTTRARLLPGITDAGGLTLWRTEFNVTLRQMLFDGFAVCNDVKGKRARVRAQAWRVSSEAERVALDVIEAFLNVNLQRQFVDHAQRNVDVLGGISGKIKERSEGGVGRKADFDQATGRNAFARTNLLAAQANLKDAETKYLRLVGLPVGNLVQPSLPAQHLPSSLSMAIAEAVCRHPELRAATTDVLVTKAARDLAKAPFYPTINLELGASKNYNLDGTPGRNDDATVMVRATWNLFRGGADVANVKQKCWKIEEAKEVRNRAHRDTEQTVRFAWNFYQTATNQIPQFAIHMNSVENVREAYRQQFDIGQRTLLDLLDTENEVLRAQDNYVKGISDQLVGSFRILRATGCLLDYLGIPQPHAARL